MSDETPDATPAALPAVQEAEPAIDPTLPPAAQRALAEAAERRKQAEAMAPPPVELGGRDGLDPARYGDWEKKGIAIDF